MPNNETYLGWLVASLSTSTGHFLSLNKSNLDVPQSKFTYLGIGNSLFAKKSPLNTLYLEFDVPAQKIRVPEERKNKIRLLIDHILTNFGKPRHFLSLKGGCNFLQGVSLFTIWRNFAAN